MTVKPVKTKLSLGFLQRSVRTWEIRRAHRLDRWHHLRKSRPRGDHDRVAAWSAFRKTDARLRQRRGELLWRQRHRQLTARDRCVAHARQFAGKVVERPAGSNRGGLITTWQRRLGAWLVGQAWCGTFAANMLLHAGVRGVSSRLASVALIEDDARAGRGCFVAWRSGSNTAGVRPGDLVVWFGRGVHVEVVVSIDHARGLVHTVGGNTSSGTGGSQANGGGVYARTRPLNQAHGFALVRFPDDKK